MQGHLNPGEAAYFAIVAMTLVLLGAILTAGPLSVEARGTVLGGIFAVLGYVGWRWRRQHRDD
jgi:hypothetical protein